MQRRQQYLLFGLIAVVVLWQGARILDSTFLQPLRDKRTELVELEKTVGLKKKDLIELARQKKSLDKWKSRSLPPDPLKNAKARPDALNAQRLYQDWLHDLAQLSGFEDLEIRPERLMVSRDNVFVSVNVKIEAHAHYEQICHFLNRFYRADILHRVTAMRVQSRESDGDPLLQITIDAEGLAIVAAPQNRRLFPQTTLEEDLAEDATELIVESTDGFPEKPDFLIRIKNELLRVTAMSGTTWTVERAQDFTTASACPVGASIEQMRLNDEVPARSAQEIKQLLASNVFVKPAPPVQYKPRIAPLGEKTLTRGKPIEFSIVALGYDPAKGRPEYSLVAPALEGSKLDKSSGKFSWSPSKEQKAGKYTFKIDVKHPSATGGRLSESVTVVLREPNTPPKIATKPAPDVFIGRPWKFALEATDAESTKTKLTWKLGENPPPGMTIDGRTGEINWTPDESTEAGEKTVQVTVTDDGSPAQSASQSLNLNVQDDAAMFTYLTTIFSVDGKVLAKLYDRSQDKSTDLRVGTRFAVADIHGTVSQIDKKQIVFTDGEDVHRLQIGQSLRESSTDKPKPGVSETPADATQPANVTAVAQKPDLKVGSDE
jgi:hypothetical protein